MLLTVDPLLRVSKLNTLLVAYARVCLEFLLKFLMSLGSEVKILRCAATVTVAPENKGSAEVRSSSNNIFRAEAHVYVGQG